MKRKNIQKQWDSAVESWVDFVRTGKDYYRDELNNPAMFELLGNIRGKKILDLGCGEGYNSRIMARKGAEVSGSDFSKKMIDFAIQQEKKEKLGIDYYVLDSCDLHIFKNNTFDIVASFMTLQDFENYQGAVKESCRVLKKHGHFIFSIPHPCFQGLIKNGKCITGWVSKNGHLFEKFSDTEDPQYYKVDQYFETGKYTIQWSMSRLSKFFETTSFHRTLTNYTDALHDAGLLISRLKEPKPTKKGIAKYPILKEVLRIPQSIVIEAVKC